MHETPNLETVSPAIFWREAARRLRLIDHEMPMPEVDVDEVFLGLRLQHELDFAAGKSAPILTRFLVLFDDELYRLLSPMLNIGSTMKKNAWSSSWAQPFQASTR